MTKKPFLLSLLVSLMLPPLVSLNGDSNDMKGQQVPPNEVFKKGNIYGEIFY